MSPTRDYIRAGVRQVPEGSGEQGKMEKTGCKIICGAPTTLADKGLMMMMKEAFIKRYIVESTNKAEIRPEEQCEKAESCQENLGNQIQLKGLDVQGKESTNKGN